jgi:hypothetical protein
MLIALLPNLVRDPASAEDQADDEAGEEHDPLLGASRSQKGAQAPAKAVDLLPEAGPAPLGVGIIVSVVCMGHFSSSVQNQAMVNSLAPISADPVPTRVGPIQGIENIYINRNISIFSRHLGIEKTAINQHILPINSEI